MQILTKHFLCLALLLPFQAVTANIPSQTRTEVCDEQFVYLSSDLREAIHFLRNVPNCKLSPRFIEICDGLAKDHIAASYRDAVELIRECLEVCKDCPDLKEVEAVVRQYETHLRNGDATLLLVDDNNVVTRACGSCNNCNTCDTHCIKFRKTKAFCNLLVNDLQVYGSGFIANFTANTLRVTGDSFFDGTVTFNGDVINAGDAVFDDLTVNGTFTANGVSNIGTNDVANDINIGTGGAGRTVTIGNDLAGSTTTITGDTSTLVLGSPADSANLNATGTINIANNNVAQTVNIATGTPLVKTVNIGTGAGANVLTLGSDTAASITENALSMNYGTGAVAKTITIGNTSDTTAVTINSGTGGVAVNSTGTGDITLTSADVLTINSTGNINIGVNNSVQDINIGTGTAQKDVIIGNTQPLSAVTIRGNAAISDGIALEAGGFVLVLVDSASSPTDTVVINARVGRATFQGFTTGAGDSQEFSIINAVMTADAAIMVTATNGGANDAQMTIQRVEPLNGSFIVTLTNNGAAPLNGDVIITFWILQN